MFMFFFAGGFTPWLSSWFCNHRPEGSNVTLKTSAIPDLTFCTLTPEARGQAGHYVRPLTTSESKEEQAFGLCAGVLCRLLWPSNQQINFRMKWGDLCVCVQISSWAESWRGREFNPNFLWSWTSGGPVLSHVCLSVQMRPTCTEWSHSRIFWWFKAHISRANIIKGSRDKCSYCARIKKFKN